MAGDSSAAIAGLNDAARTSFIGCRVVITPGIAGIEDLDGLYAKVRSFDEFTERNDPYGEHDFGTVEHKGQSYAVPQEVEGGRLGSSPFGPSVRPDWWTRLRDPQ